MVITTDGKNRVRDLIINKSSVAFDGIAVGTDNTTASVSQTALIARVYGETTTKTEPMATSVKFDMDMGTSDYPPTGTVTLKEVGLFTSADGSSGTMFCRQVMGDTVKTTSIAYRFQFSVDVVWA